MRPRLGSFVAQRGGRSAAMVTDTSSSSMRLPRRNLSARPKERASAWRDPKSTSGEDRVLPQDVPLDRAKLVAIVALLNEQ